MKNKSGFTIIETVLVLAIAGLIIVMAFVALPSLWASQRDADRRANVMNFVSALKTYQTNNSRGALPDNGTAGIYNTAKKNPGSYTASSWEGLIQDYYLKNDSLADPSGEIYKIQVANCNASSAGDRCYIGDNNFDNNVNASTTPSFDASNPVIYVVTGATCSESSQVVKTNNNRYVAAVQVLERGKYCQNT